MTGNSLQVLRASGVAVRLASGRLQTSPPFAALPAEVQALIRSSRAELLAELEARAARQLAHLEQFLSDARRFLGSALPKADLYAAYREACTVEGLDPLDEQQFRSALEQFGPAEPQAPLHPAAGTGVYVELADGALVPWREAGLVRDEARAAVRQFLAESCTVEPGASARCFNILDAFADWTRPRRFEDGSALRVDVDELERVLSDLGFTRAPGRDGQRWQGLRLRDGRKASGASAGAAESSFEDTDERGRPAEGLAGGNAA